MHTIKSRIGRALIFAGLLAPFLTTACAVRVHEGYRVYDRPNGDYHVWNNGEAGYYNRWVVENHRENRDFRKLKREDQERYWKWRHDQK
jgi:hypothetical protein